MPAATAGNRPSGRGTELGSKPGPVRLYEGAGGQDQDRSDDEEDCHDGQIQAPGGTLLYSSAISCLSRVPQATCRRSDAIDVYGQWEVKPLRCYEQGLTLQGIKLPRVSHELADDPASAVFLEFLAAAVCHSTNWDRLRSHLLTIAHMPSRFAPARLAELSFDEFIVEFAPAFPTANDLPRRRAMVATVAKAFAYGTAPFDGKAIALDTWHLSGPDGLYAAIDTLEPFSADPHRKKTRILIQQLFRHGLLQVMDPEHVQPAIEYHLVRLYLRTGRVVHSGTGRPSPGNQRASDIRSVTALRAAVEEAMHYTADAAGLPISDVNEIEWQVARSYCERDAPRCAGPYKLEKPVASIIAKIASGGCPFSDTCDAPHCEKIAQIVEPRLADHHGYY